MSVRSKIDFSELNDYLNKMKIMEEEYNEFLKDCVIEFGEEAAELAASFTPVDTGALKASWGLSTKWMVPHHTRLWSSKKNREVDKVLFTRGGGVRTSGSGKNVSVVVSNPQAYAQIIEDKYGMLASALAIVRARMPEEYNAKFEAFKKSKGL